MAAAVMPGDGARLRQAVAALGPRLRDPAPLASDPCAIIKRLAAGKVAGIAARELQYPGPALSIRGVVSDGSMKQ